MTNEASTNYWHRARAGLSAVFLVSFLTAAPATAQVELLKLLPPTGWVGDPAAYDYFGESVSISGNRAILGASGDDDAGMSSGTAYLYDTTSGAMLFELHHQGAVTEDYFGRSVAISGDYAVVGAFGRDDAGDRSGSAYVFDVLTGQQHRQLLPSAPDAKDFFGGSVALDGNLAVIGALGDDDNGGSAGAAYVFDVRTGLELFKLVASDGAPGEWFGDSVAISGDLAVIGATRDDDHGYHSGSAYVFDTRTGQELHQLHAADATVGDNFGVSVGISGDLAVVGAYLADGTGPYSGAVYLFDATTGQQLFKLFPSDGASNDFFGTSVAISGDRVLVGADGYDEDINGQGAAYLFDATTGVQLYRIIASDGATDDRFGAAVSLRGDRALVGAPWCDAPDQQSGAAYLYQVVERLFVTPASPFGSEGNVGGPFYADHHEYTLHNSGSADLQYLVAADQPWISLSSETGVIPSGGTVVVDVGFGPLAASLGLGLHQAQVDFENLTTHSGDTSRQGELHVQEGLPERLHHFPLDADPGWTCQGQWEFGEPAGEGGDELLGPDPPSGHTGPNVYGYNLQGDYPNNMMAYHLTTPALDCSGSTATTLRFWRWLNVERAAFDHAYVRASNDGSTWVDIWENPASPSIGDLSWQAVEYDLSAVADGQSTVYLRWTMGSSDYLYPASGWNIDDVEVWGDAPPPPGLAYCSGQAGSGTPCPCSNASDGTLPGAGCANGVFASGAYLTATGTASVTGDTLVLRATHQEPDNSGLYFQGATDLSPGIVWGDGLRCTGGAIRRLQVRFADAGGSSLTSIPIGVVGAVSAGDTRYYQLWYRTIVAPPCGPGVNEFNSSNGYAITWMP